MLRRRCRSSSMSMPVPYGAHVMPDGVQFTIVSRHARRVWLMLFETAEARQPDQEYELNPAKHRIGDIWHIHLPDARPGQFYAYRMEGYAERPDARYFDPDQWLLDPYALAISWFPQWGDKRTFRPGHAPRGGEFFPKGVIVDDNFDWSNDRPPQVALNESIIYETHLRGYTVHPSSGVRHPGTYKGFIEKIPHLKKLGITTVEFLPLQEFNEMEYYLENTNRKNLRNFWGYSTLAFFAPNGRYAAGGVNGQQVREFQELVLALHKAGIEVVLDVVFNHTAEGGDGGPTYSFRGIDNDIFYMMGPHREHYMNFSGCGNTVNCNHPIVRDFIVDCLRYWVLHMHVDGFRFDLASVLARDQNGQVLPNPPAIEHIAEDPALRHTKIIAEAWDAAGLYQVGSFPNERWSEWNGRYRDDIRSFWRGDPDLLRTFVTRLIGSPDLYLKNDQTPQKSINFIACHDGFTLRDIVCYNDKHNKANGENNRDGEDHNRSANYGREGFTRDPRINRIRKRQQKNLLATLLLSQGVPMLLAGDEFSRTQQGNNNAYCQDNELSWVDWKLLKDHDDLFAFTRELIAFRKAHPTLMHRRFLRDHDQDGEPRDIHWFGPKGEPVDWEHGQAIACLLYGNGPEHDHQRIPSLFMIFNAADKPTAFCPPKPPGASWRVVLSTEERKPRWRRGQRNLNIDARSVTVLSST